MRSRGALYRFPSGLWKGLTGIGAVLAAGVAGYRIIEHWPWPDCLYMTVITVSTVGFTEVHPLSPLGRIFTVALIFFGVGTVAYCLTRLVELVFQRSLTNVFGRRSMMNRIEHMKKHCIICGYGRTGNRVAAELMAEGKDFVVVEQNPETVRRLEELGIPHVEGDATDEDALAAANIRAADSLVAALGSDAENLFLTLTANGLCPGVRIIARVHEPESTRKFLKAGARRVVSPIASGASQIAQLVSRPSVVDLVELVAMDKSIALQVFEHAVDEKNPMLGKTLSEGRVRQALGGMVIAIKHANGHTAFDPGPDTRLALGDILVAIRQSEPDAPQA